MYVPVVEKQILWSKRCKDPALVSTVRETITQVSHSKKWASSPALDENGQPMPLIVPSSAIPNRITPDVKLANALTVFKKELVILHSSVLVSFISVASLISNQSYHGQNENATQISPLHFCCNER